MKSRLQIESTGHFGLLELTVGYLLHLCVSMVFAAAPIFVMICGIMFVEVSSAPREYALFFSLLGIFVTLALFLIFIPIVQVNPFVQAVIERALGLTKSKSVVYDCQITFSPRLNRGLRRLLDDADDVGRLEIASEGVTFHGGSVALTLSFRDIDSSKKMPTKARNLWVAGGSTRLETTAFDGVKHIEFFERQSRTSWNSRRISAEIAYAIEYGMQCESEKRAEL